MVETRTVYLRFRGGALSLFGRALLAGIISAFIIPAAWGAVPFVRWLVDQIEFSDGETASIEGRPSDAWLLFAGYMLVSFLPSIANVIFRERPEIGLVVSLATMLLTTYLTIQIWKWYAANLRIGPTTNLTFEGSWLGMLGYVLLIVISFCTIVGWAWAMTAYQRWLVRNFRGDGLELEFVGSGLGLLWRVILSYLACILIIPIPWVMKWLMGWFVANTVIYRTATASLSSEPLA